MGRNRRQEEDNHDTSTVPPPPLRGRGASSTNSPSEDTDLRFPSVFEQEAIQKTNNPPGEGGTSVTNSITKDTDLLCLASVREPDVVQGGRNRDPNNTTQDEEKQEELSMGDDDRSPGFGAVRIVNNSATTDQETSIPAGASSEIASAVEARQQPPPLVEAEVAPDIEQTVTRILEANKQERQDNSLVLKISWKMISIALFIFCTLIIVVLIVAFSLALSKAKEGETSEEESLKKLEGQLLGAASQTTNPTNEPTAYFLTDPPTQTTEPPTDQQAEPPTDQPTDPPTEQPTDHPTEAIECFVTTPVTDLDSVTRTISFTFTGVGTAVGNVSLTFYARGDLSDVSEYYDVTVTGGTTIATSLFVEAAECSLTYSTETIIATEADFNAWASNGSLSINMHGSVGVGIICNNNAYLEVLYATSESCPVVT